MYDFDDAVSEHKSNLIQSMKDFGEGKRIHHILKGIDLNICDYEFYFYKGQQSRQEEFDKLQDEIDELQKRINFLEVELKTSNDAIALKSTYKVTWGKGNQND